MCYIKQVQVTRSNAFSWQLTYIEDWWDVNTKIYTMGVIQNCKPNTLNCDLCVYFIPGLVWFPERRFPHFFVPPKFCYCRLFLSPRPNKTRGRFHDDVSEFSWELIAFHGWHLNFRSTLAYLSRKWHRPFTKRTTASLTWCRIIF